MDITSADAVKHAAVKGILENVGAERMFILRQMLGATATSQMINFSDDGTKQAYSAVKSIAHDEAHEQPVGEKQWTESFEYIHSSIQSLLDKLQCMEESLTSEQAAGLGVLMDLLAVSFNMNEVEHDSRPVANAQYEAFDEDRGPCFLLNPWSPVHVGPNSHDVLRAMSPCSKLNTDNRSLWFSHLIDSLVHCKARKGGTQFHVYVPRASPRDLNLQLYHSTGKMRHCCVMYTTTMENKTVDILDHFVLDFGAMTWVQVA